MLNKLLSLISRPSKMQKRAAFCLLTTAGMLLGQLSLLTAPAMAQGYPLQNYYPDYRQYGYSRGTGGFPFASYSPYTTGPQYGYSAWRGSPTGNGAGTAIGLGLYGGIIGIGALSMAPRLMAQHRMNKQHNNPKANQKLASKDRRQEQELKIRGELDQDYQKELSEKGMLPPTASLPPGNGFGAGIPAAPSPGGFGSGMGSGMGSNIGSGMGSAMQSAPAFTPVGGPPAAAPILNNTPWTP